MAAPEMGLSKITQIGIVVRDLEAGMEKYRRLLGVGPWRVHTSSAPPIRCSYRGEPIQYEARIANAQAGPILVELIQPISGASTYQDFLEEHGEGVHHIAVDVPNMDEASAPLKEQGIEILQSGDGTGASRDGRYAYLDTEAALGTLLELRQPPTQRGPQTTYP